MKSPDKCSLDELRPYASEYARRVKLGKPSRPKVLRPCPKCGQPQSAREMRRHLPLCGRSHP